MSSEDRARSLARWARHLRGIRHVAGQLIGQAWSEHQGATAGRTGEPDRLDALIDCARLADYGQGECVNAEIGDAIAARLETSVRFDLHAAKGRAARDRGIVGLFGLARVRGVGRTAAYTEIADLFGTTPDTVRKVISAASREAFEEQFPDLDAGEIDALMS